MWPESESHWTPWSLWWAGIDRWILASTLVLMAIGAWLIMAASPAVALQHKWSSFLLLKRHFMMLSMGIVLMIITSFGKKETLVRVSKSMGVVAWIGAWIVIAWGMEIKGARRWLSLGFFSLQPSEFIKPALVIVTAQILSQETSKRFLQAAFWFCLAVGPLFFQPDLGMIFLMSSVWFTQCFLGGLPWKWTWSAMAGAVVAALLAYWWFPHAAHRIEIFLGRGGHDPFGSHYQISQALKSFSSGGVLGRGPGGGVLVNHLPDGHADFIFAVAGEEFGLIVCLCIIGLYGLIIFRSLWHAFQEEEGFYFLAISGLGIQMAFQVTFNIASVLHLMPTKGMTLPFLSYGGSSLLSLCWSMGMLLALTRRYRGI